MTGAGFGGCMIALMPREGLEAALSAIDGAYRAVIGLIPEFYHVNIGKGARLL
jgi:galactokinase